MTCTAGQHGLSLLSREWVIFSQCIVQSMLREGRYLALNVTSMFFRCVFIRTNSVL